jgi:hypothetical protein
VYRWIFALAGFALGCRDLERFDTDGAAAYCGELTGSPFADALTADSAPPIRARLELDTSRLESTPGVVTTSDAVDGLCAPEPLLNAALLRAIPELTHDPLSMLEFGSGRDHNFFAWVDSTCQGTMVAVVSLMQNEKVELRLLKPAPMSADGANAPPGEKSGFGMFSLRRENSGDCF